MDSNLWIYGSRMFRGPLGAALLHAIEQADARIGLPEVVEREIRPIFTRLVAEKSEKVRQALQDLALLTGYHCDVDLPADGETLEAFEKRIANLGGSIERLPFNWEQAQGATERVLQSTPPNSQNNQQFKDSAIWEAVSIWGKAWTVHFATRDKAFFQDKEPQRGLATSLRSELETSGSDVQVHYDLSACLAAIRPEVPSFDNESALDAINPSLSLHIEQALAGRGFLIGSRPNRPRLRPFASGEPNVLAVEFDILRELVWDPEFHQSVAYLRCQGECLLNPKTNEVSEVALRSVSIIAQDGRQHPEMPVSISFLKGSHKETKARSEWSTRVDVTDEDR